MLRIMWVICHVYLMNESKSKTIVDPTEMFVVSTDPSG